MTISPLLRENINVPVDKMGLSSSKACFVDVDKGSGIIEFFNVVSSILLGTVAPPTDKIFNGLTFTFLDLAFVEEFFYIKAFLLIGIAFDKLRRGVRWKEPREKVLCWG